MALAPRCRSPAHYLGAMLIARLFVALPVVFPRCGADLRIVTFVTEAAPVLRILTHTGAPAEPHRTGRSWRNPHPSTSSTRTCSGSRLASPSVVGTRR